MFQIRPYIHAVRQNKLVLITALLLASLCASCVNSNGSEHPSPVLSDVSPAAVMAGSSAFTLKLRGSGFVEQSKVSANNSALDTTYVSATELSAQLPAGLLATAGVLNLSVSQPEFGSSAAAPFAFTVIAPGEVIPTTHPQVVAYAITVPRDAKVTIEFEAPGQPVRRTWTRPTPAGGGEVGILVGGMVAFTTYTLRAIVEFPDGTKFIDADKSFTTGGLPPERTPAITVTQSDVLSPNPGVQLWDMIGTSSNGSIALVTNLDGNIVWFHESPIRAPLIIRHLSNGNFLINSSTLGQSDSPLQEIDLVGNVIRQITSGEINAKLIARGLEPVAGLIHHDVIMLPNGHLMALTAFNKTFTDLVGFEGQAVEVVGDSLVQLDENLDPVWTWSSFDHLDVNRHPFSDPEPPDSFDWTHGNAVTYVAADGSLLISLRHQDWVLKIDYQDGLGSGAVLWRLGFEGDFDLLDAGPEGWQYAQHFPFVIEPEADGEQGDAEPNDILRLAIWDNGNFRVIDELTGATCDPDVLGSCYSRPVIYEIDESLNTVRIVWEDILDFFSPLIGSIQVFDDGNVLWDAGTIMGAGPTPMAIVREVTQEVPPQTVWQADVSGPFVYRSLRLPSLYPGVEW